MDENIVHSLHRSHFVINPIHRRSGRTEKESGQGVMAMLWIMACPKGLIRLEIQD